MAWLGRRKNKQQLSSRERRARQDSQLRRSVFSYYNNRSPQSSSSGRENEASYSSVPRTSGGVKRWLRNMPSIIALLAVTFSILYCLSLSTKPKLTIITGSTKTGSGLRDKAEYQQGAEHILNQSLLSRTKFTINTNGFAKAFQEQFPEVSDVAVTLPLVSRRPIVTITTAQPAIILTNQSQAYVLDKRGTVIMPASDLGDDARRSLPIVHDQSGLEVSPGKTVLPADYVQFMVAVMAQLKAKNIAVESMTLPNQAHQIDVKIDGQPYYVKFSVDTDAREAAGAFLATKQKLEQDKTTPSQYIDVRVPGRAYYL